MVLKSIPDLDVRFVCPRKGVCLFDLIILWDTMKTLYLHKRVFMTSHIQYREKFLDLDQILTMIFLKFIFLVFTFVLVFNHKH